MKYDVFLSFTTKDKKFADIFRGEMKNGQPDIVFRDYSIKEAFEQAWKTNAERLIRDCSTTLCLIGKTTHSSRAVDWEIRTSVELGKHVMAVSIEPTRKIVIPPALMKVKVRTLSRDIKRIAGELNDIGTKHTRTGAFRRAHFRNDERYRSIHTA